VEQLRNGVHDHRLHARPYDPGRLCPCAIPVPARVIFVFLLLALIVPYQALLTPLFLMFAQVKITNTLVGLAILHTTIQIPFSLYVMRNSFESVPKELEEAAVTDGASSLQALRSIFLPAVVPAIVTVALFAFVTSWNEFLGPGPAQPRVDLRCP
jgi:multiple sugar transport system permease protein